MLPEDLPSCLSFAKLLGSSALGKLLNQAQAIIEESPELARRRSKNGADVPVGPGMDVLVALEASLESFSLLPYLAFSARLKPRPAASWQSRSDKPPPSPGQPL